MTYLSLSTRSTLRIPVVMEVGSRRLLHIGVTDAPAAAWIEQQLREAVSDEHPWRFLVHDRDGVFNRSVDDTVKGQGLKVLLTPPQAPQANSFCERLIGTLRRDCLDHFIVLGERHLRKVLAEYAGHYNRGRPHMSLGPGIPEPPEGVPVEERGDRHAIPEGFEVIASPVLSGLHHEYRLQ